MNIQYDIIRKNEKTITIELLKNIDFNLDFRLDLIKQINKDFNRSFTWFGYQEYKNSINVVLGIR
jgi:hypothetical protein